MSGGVLARLNRIRHTRFVKFLAVGLLNTCFGFMVYAVLVWLGVNPQPALALAFIMGIAWNYMTHARLVFATRGVARLPPYVAAYLSIYALNAAALAVLLRWGMGPYAAQALIVLPSAGIAFLLIGRVLTGRFPIGS